MEKYLLTNTYFMRIMKVERGNALEATRLNQEARRSRICFSGTRWKSRHIRTQWTERTDSATRRDQRDYSKEDSEEVGIEIIPNFSGLQIINKKSGEEQK